MDANEKIIKGLHSFLQMTIKDIKWSESFPNALNVSTEYLKQHNTHVVTIR